MSDKVSSLAGAKEEGLKEGEYQKTLSVEKVLKSIITYTILMLASIK